MNCVVGNCGSVVESDFYTRLEKLDARLESRGQPLFCSLKIEFFNTAIFLLTMCMCACILVCVCAKV